MNKKNINILHIYTIVLSMMNKVAVIDHVLFFCTRSPSLPDLFACFTPIFPLPLPYHHLYYYYHLLPILRPTKDTLPS